MLHNWQNDELPPPGCATVNHTFTLNDWQPIVDQRCLKMLLLWLKKTIKGGKKRQNLWESCGESRQVEMDPDSRGKLHSRSFIRKKPKIQAKLFNTGKFWDLAILHSITQLFMVCATLRNDLTLRVRYKHGDVMQVETRLRLHCSDISEGRKRYLPKPTVKNWSLYLYMSTECSSGTYKSTCDSLGTRQSNRNESSTCQYERWSDR